MATLTFNGTTQYTEFSTLTGGLQNVTAGAHTCVALVRRTIAGAFNDPHAISDPTLTITHAGAKFSNVNAVQYDITRPPGGTGDAINHNSTTIWAMIATTFDVADTPDFSLHFRDHTTNAAWTHTAGGTSPGNASGPGATAFMQHGRWETADFWQGQIGVVAAWATRLTNAQLDELKANDKTSDWWNCSAGRPLHLIEFNVAETSLVDLTGNSTRVAPAAAPALTGPDPDRWTFDGLGSTTAVAFQPRRMPQGV
jgi:hypothetical protein